MSTTACHRTGFLLAVAVAAVSPSSAAEARHWRYFESGISLSDEQRATLYDLTAAIYRATTGLVGACPAEDRFTALGRLDAKQRQLRALRHGIDAIQPVLSKFEDSLNDSQRTRLAIAVTG
jgi:hypothetical protein